MNESPAVKAAGFFVEQHATVTKGTDMSLSSAKNYALRAAKSQDQKEATELLSKAILELTLAIEATDAKIKKINKSS
jgi:hypothetical protein